jgi:hypothetical protein
MKSSNVFLIAKNRYRSKDSIFNKSLENTFYLRFLIENTKCVGVNHNRFVRSRRTVRHTGECLKLRDFCEKRREYFYKSGDSTAYILYENQLPLIYEKYCIQEYGMDNDLIDARQESEYVTDGFRPHTKQMKYLFHKKYGR